MARYPDHPIEGAHVLLPGRLDTNLEFSVLGFELQNLSPGKLEKPDFM